MCNAAGQLAQRFHALRLGELRLGLLAILDLVPDPLLQLLVQPLQRLQRRLPLRQAAAQCIGNRIDLAQAERGRCILCRGVSRQAGQRAHRHQHAPRQQGGQPKACDQAERTCHE